MGYLVAIAVAAFFDTLFATGYFFYGTGVSATTVVALVQNISLAQIYAIIVVSCFAADVVNYVFGYFFKSNKRIQNIIARTTEHRLLQQVMYTPTDALPKQSVLALLFRFVAPIRPANAIMLAIISGRPMRDLTALFFAVLIWSGGWLLVVYFGVDLFVA